MTEVARLAERLFGAPRPLAWAVAEATEVCAATLSAAELGVVQPSWRTARRHSFALGRLAAHRALARLAPRVRRDVLRGPGGAPAWPSGVRGSISHTDRWAVAAVAQGGSVAIGIDILAPASVEPALAPYVLTPAELARRPGLALGDTLAAKEAAVKALWTARGALYAPTALTVDPEARSVSAPDGTVAALSLAAGRRFTLALCTVDGHA